MRPGGSGSVSHAATQQEALRRALAAGQRPPRASALTACRAFAWRGLLKIRHVPEQLMDATVTPVLFTVMFTYMFGGAIAGSTKEYLQFILPGIVVQSVIFTTVYSGVALNTDMTRGVVDRFRSLPLWRPAPLIGAVAGDSVRALGRRRRRRGRRPRARLPAGRRRRRACWRRSRSCCCSRSRSPGCSPRWDW